MTIAELKAIIADYPDDQSVHMRIWLKPHRDYLDDEIVQATVSRYKCSTTGSLLLIGEDGRLNR